MSQSTIVPMVRITPNTILRYNTFLEGPRRTEAQEKTTENLTRGDYNGFLSPKSKAKLKNAISILFGSIQEARSRTQARGIPLKYYLTFVTVTLPAKQRHSDKELKRQCLTHFITVLERKYKIRNYLWRAEAQANGNIHFHILIDRFIPHQSLRNSWNSIISKLGYIADFKEVHGHTNPNSTDIKAIGNVKMLAAYMSKYMMKNEDRRKIEGRLWGCSDGLRQLKGFTMEIDSLADYMLTTLEKDKKISCFRGEKFEVYSLDVCKWLESNNPPVYNKFKKFLWQTFLNMYTSTKPPVTKDELTVSVVQQDVTKKCIPRINSSQIDIRFGQQLNR